MPQLIGSYVTHWLRCFQSKRLKSSIMSDVVNDSNKIQVGAEKLFDKIRITCLANGAGTFSYVIAPKLWMFRDQDLNSSAYVVWHPVISQTGKVIAKKWGMCAHKVAKTMDLSKVYILFNDLTSSDWQQQIRRPSWVDLISPEVCEGCHIKHKWNIQRAAG